MSLGSQRGLREALTPGWPQAGEAALSLAVKQPQPGAD